MVKDQDLKREIAMNRYEIDAGAVAAAIVSTLGLIRLGRLVLVASEAGHSPPEPPRDDHR